jgi:hypothetical protein
VRRPVLLALAVLFTAGVAWSDAATQPVFKRVAQTRHARYYATHGQKVDARRSEAFLARLFSLFGGAPQGWRLEYYRHASVADLSAQVGFAAYGVTDVGALRIDSVRDYHAHELVHAVAGRLGQPPVLFTEGLAVALTAEGRWRSRDVDAVSREYLAAHGSLERLLKTFAEQDPDRDYAVAGSFVAFLLDRDGIEPMIAFLVGCGPDQGRYEQALRTAYGRGLADLEYEWHRRLREGSTSSTRVWYDARGWPGTLRRPPTESVATIPAPVDGVVGPVTRPAGAALERVAVPGRPAAEAAP